MNQTKSAVKNETLINRDHRIQLEFDAQFELDRRQEESMEVSIAFANAFETLRLAA